MLTKETPYNLRILHWDEVANSIGNMPSFGRISEFDETKEDWTQYIERVES